MSGGAVIIRRQNRLMEQFRAAGATSAANAVDPDALGCRVSWVFRRMVSQGVFLDAGDGRFYLDENGAARFVLLRRVRIVVFTVVMLLVFVVYIALLPR